MIYSMVGLPMKNATNSPSITIGSSVIPIINKVQDIFSPFDNELCKIPLPQIAVVGSQSSGKSSVLEALVGRDFLPRGCDICTRRPLVLMLQHHPRIEGDAGEEWGEFRHLPGMKFHDFSKIRAEIQSETENVAGCNKGVSSEQIRLTISSPNVLNMTLIDLPGITKVPVGDQPSDIEARVRAIIMDYITQENCIILAVSPANSDLATSDALQMAKAADPTGSRTIGVITKLDIMDKGTNACNFLLGKIIPLSLGYVGVVNRSQEDINNNRSIADALAYEEQFFHDNPAYQSLTDRCGIRKLAKKLNQILERHIRKVLPGLKAELNSCLNSKVKELQTYGETLESKAKKGSVLLNILTKYSEAFAAMLDGKGRELSTRQLSGGARINYIFQSIFVKILEEVDPCEGLTDDDIGMAIQNATGTRNALFVPEVPFELLITKQIGRLLDPSLQCLKFVYEELIEMSRACETNELHRFPILRRRLDEVMRKFLCDNRNPADRMIKNMIEMEMDYINTSHPNFIGGSTAVQLAMTELNPTQPAVSDEVASVANGVLPNQDSHPQSNNEKPILVGNSSLKSWGITSIFRSMKPSEHTSDSVGSTIQLREPPSIVHSAEMQYGGKVDILVTKILLRSYFDVVRKNVQDLVPKAIMHFLVNHTKRDLLSTSIQNLYKEDLIEEILQEEEDITTKRKMTEDMFYALQQAIQTLEEVELDVTSQGSSSYADVGTAIADVSGCKSIFSKNSTVNQMTLTGETKSSKDQTL